MPGETVRAVRLQPDWLRALHAQTGGRAAAVEQALGLEEALPAQTRWARAPAAFR